MTYSIPHPGKHFLFALLSLADLTLTWWLLERSAGIVYEANPVANWWLTQHGWTGLAAFKVVAVLLVVGLIALISRFRPQIASRLLGFACAVSALVVFYSIGLCQSSLSPEQLEKETTRLIAGHIEKMNDETARAFRKRQAFWDLLRALRAELIAERCSLADAVQRIREVKGRDKTWLQGLALLHPDRSVDERIALCLIRQMYASNMGSSQTWQLILQLERDFQLTYGSPLPPGFLNGMRPSSQRSGKATPAVL